MNALNILSGGAAQGLVGSLAAKFKALTGLDIEGEFGAVGAMADKLRQATPTDIVILTATLVAKLADENGWSPPRSGMSAWSRPRSRYAPPIRGSR
jgi:molybdate transport system substrate-binding protein